MYQSPITFNVWMLYFLFKDSLYNSFVWCASDLSQIGLTKRHKEETKGEKLKNKSQVLDLNLQE